MGKVAEQIGGSVDAVRHEVVRLQERAEREQAAPAPEEGGPVSSPVQSNSSDRMIDLYAYILATNGIVPEVWTNRLQDMLQARVGQAIKQFDLVPDEQQLERYRFQLEEQLSSLKKQQQAEEMVDRVNQLIAIMVTKSLRESRVALEEAELIADEETIQQVLQELQFWQRMRAKEPYTVEALLGDAPLD